MKISCFKAYDIRGQVPDQLNEEIVSRIGRAYAQFLVPEKVIIGRDVRPTSHIFAEALSHGLVKQGVDVLDIGLCGTEEIYFATSFCGAGGGIMITASHNPSDYNGMKLVREKSKPISGDTGLKEIQFLAEQDKFQPSQKFGRVSALDIKKPYIEHLISYIDTSILKPLKIVVNAGNGCAGPIIDLLEDKLPFKLIKICHEPNGTFPNGIPNPLLPENRELTREAVLRHQADLGIAWDGDFDRCFLFDEEGAFIEGYYIVGLLAESLLKHHKGAKIIHDPRLTWNTVEMVRRAGGVPVMSKTGHAFIKERMRSEDALYGGEMSAHHYFRDFAYCDSGMIPWLLVVELMCRTGQRLSELVGERMAIYPASGEINRVLQDSAAAIAAVEKHYAPQALSIDYTDGLSIEFANWRFNLRMSNTEPVLRLNVEARKNKDLVGLKTKEILSLLENY
ncbi:MAG: phosphomannomutase [Deltaproteobacteria bacterium]|nr:phosphomannomutase [Deltaproteobacteria bacterium]